MSTHNGPFGIVPAAAIFDKRLTDFQIRVLAALAAHADKNRECHPKQETISNALGRSREAVNRAVSKLVSFGYLKAEDQFTERGAQKFSRYWIIFDQDEQSPRCDPTITGKNTAVDEVRCDPTVTPRCDPTITGGVIPGSHHEQYQLEQTIRTETRRPKPKIVTSHKKATRTAKRERDEQEALQAAMAAAATAEPRVSVSSEKLEKSALWQALVAVTWEPDTPQELSRFRTACAILHKRHATPEEVQRRVEIHNQDGLPWRVTPMALVNNWGQLAASRKKETANVSAQTRSQSNGVSLDRIAQIPAPDSRPISDAEAEAARRKKAALVAELSVSA